MRHEAEKGYRLERWVSDPKYNLDHVYTYKVSREPVLRLNFCFPDAFAVSWPTRLASVEFVHVSAAFLQGLSLTDFAERPPTSETGTVTLTAGQRAIVPATYSGQGKNNIYVSGHDNRYPECYIPFEDLANNQLSDGVTKPDFLMTKSGYKIKLGRDRFIRINAEYCSLIFGNEEFRSFTYWSHLVPDIDMFFELFDQTTRRKIPKEPFGDILSILLGSPIGEKVFPQASPDLAIGDKPALKGVRPLDE